MKASKLGVVIFLVMVSLSQAAQWQWSVLLADKNHVAYLWISPSCNHVRGIILGDINMLEVPVLNDPVIRDTAAKCDLAIVLCVPKSFMWFKYKEGADKIMLKMFDDLAAVSGYSELKYAPVIPIGHSASTPFCWNFGYWNPNRTIAIISLKGAAFSSPAFDPNASIENIPALDICGEYFEWPVPQKSRFISWQLERDKIMAMRAKSQNNLITYFVDVSRGHFDYTSDLARILAMYITKAVQYRVPQNAPLDGPVALKTISPRSGWLMDPNTVRLNHIRTAAYDDYAGNKETALWVFDKELAQAMDVYGAEQKTKKYQMVSVVQDGNLLAVAEKGYAAPMLKTMPNDELSLTLQGGYLETVPVELQNDGPLTGHSSSPVHFMLINGPLVQTGPDSFRIAFNRLYKNAPTKATLLVFSPGDEKYRMAYQPVMVDIPANKEGRPQKITFGQIPNQTVGVKNIKLYATSDSNLPVEYFVNYGPAEIEGDKLIFGPIPPRSKFPVKVSVVAYQPGRVKEPRVQMAPQVEQAFLIENGEPNSIKSSDGKGR